MYRLCKQFYGCLIAKDEQITKRSHLCAFSNCRLKPLPGTSGINKFESSSDPTNSGVRTTLGSGQEGPSLHRDNTATLEHRVSKGNNRLLTHIDSALPLYFLQWFLDMPYLDFCV